MYLLGAARECKLCLVWERRLERLSCTAYRQSRSSFSTSVRNTRRTDGARCRSAGVAGRRIAAHSRRARMVRFSPADAPPDDAEQVLAPRGGQIGRVDAAAAAWVATSTSVLSLVPRRRVARIVRGPPPARGILINCARQPRRRRDRARIVCGPHHTDRPRAAPAPAITLINARGSRGVATTATLP